MNWNLVILPIWSLYVLYIFLCWPKGLLWSMRRVYDHDRVVRSLAGLLGVAPTPGTVLNMLHALVEEIELHPVSTEPHPFFASPAVVGLIYEQDGDLPDFPERFRDTISFFAGLALPQERGYLLFSYKRVTHAFELDFDRQWAKQNPYDDFEERALVKYLRSTPRVVFWPSSAY